MTNDLKRLRRTADLTQQQLARRLRVRQHEISRWELGRHTPRAELLPRYAKILGVTPEKLLRAILRNRRSRAV